MTAIKIIFYITIGVILAAIVEGFIMWLIFGRRAKPGKKG